MQGAVAGDEISTFGSRELAEGVVQRLGGRRGVEPRERIAPALG